MTIKHIISVIVGVFLLAVSFSTSTHALALSVEPPTPPTLSLLSYPPYPGLYPSYPPLNDPHWSVVQKGDFNADGYDDIVWRSNLGEVAIWLLNGQGAFVSGGDLTSFTPTDAQSFGVIDLGFKIVAIADMNGDGYDDLIWRDKSRDISAVWYLSANAYTGVSFKSGTVNTSHAIEGTDYGYFHNEEGQKPGSNWSIVAAGDITGNRFGDLIWQDNTSGLIAVWEMNNSLYPVKAFYTPSLPSTDWEIVDAGYLYYGNFMLFSRNRITNTKSVWYFKPFYEPLMPNKTTTFASGAQDYTTAVPNVDYKIYFSVPPIY